MNELDWGSINALKDSKGKTLQESCESEKVLLVFLRHFGCTYCRKVVSEFSKDFFEGRVEGVFPIFVHMSKSERGDEFFESYGLKGVSHISDPKKTLYKSFGLRRGSFIETMGPRVVIGGAKDLLKFGVGMLEGDGFQMHGAVLIENKIVQKEFVPDHVGDHVDLKVFVKNLANDEDA